jgi:hypothetical protein
MGMLCILFLLANFVHFRKGIFGLTFSPMHRIVPTSDSASGERSLPTVSTFPVGLPGSRTDEPLYVSTLTSFPATIAAPTSRSLSTGWPIVISLVEVGMKRMRPEGYLG